MIATWVAAVGSALLGGLYLAFSVAVMPALARRPPAEAAAVMREVNRVILGPVFGLLFAGTAVACVLVFVGTVFVGTVFVGTVFFDDGGGAGWRVAGGLVGLAGFVTTAVVNIPLNNRLDRDGESAWTAFAGRWTRWNHVRAATSVAATVLMVVAAG